MLSPLRNRFGIPGVISVIALVFAMFGGAYAANTDGGGGKATASAKGKPGPRGPRGKTGPAGPAGPQGPAGAKGDTGAAGSNGKDGAPGAEGKAGKDGTNGTNGTNGTSATVASFAGSKGTCSEGQGGLEVKSASPAAFVCNGKEGSPWTAGGTLPSGATETGAWSSLGGPVAAVPLSFSIPLAAEIEGGKTHLMKKGFPTADKTACEAESEPEKAECLADLATLETNCPGNAKEPKAAKGHLCVYTGAGSFNAGPGESLIVPPGSAAFESGASRSGANLFLIEGAPDFGFLLQGTWAVTAP